LTGERVQGRLAAILAANVAGYLQLLKKSPSLQKKETI
jgi:hypothetical protein